MASSRSEGDGSMMPGEEERRHLRADADADEAAQAAEFVETGETVETGDPAEMDKSVEAEESAEIEKTAETEESAGTKNFVETEKSAETKKSVEAEESAETKKTAEAEKPENPRKRKKSSSGKKKVKKRKKRTVKGAAIGLIVRIGVIALVVWILLTYVGGVFICHSSDMYPALRDGDLAITFRLGEYKSGDIIAYKMGDSVLFGRIIGEPGDEIYIDAEGEFTVNGIRPYETIFYETSLRESDTQTFPVTISEGEYFVLADAREQAVDSRNFGPVTEPLGKIVLQLRRRGF